MIVKQPLITKIWFFLIKYIKVIILSRVSLPEEERAVLHLLNMLQLNSRYFRWDLLPTETSCNVVLCLRRVVIPIVTCLIIVTRCNHCDSFRGHDLGNRVIFLRFLLEKPGRGTLKELLQVNRLELVVSILHMH